MSVPTYVCCQCQCCGMQTDIEVPPKWVIGEELAATCLPSSVTVPGTAWNLLWARLAELLGMPLEEVAELSSEGCLLPLVIEKLEGG